MRGVLQRRTRKGDWAVVALPLVPADVQRYMGVALEPLCSNVMIDADRIEVALDDCCARQLVPTNRWRQSSARSSRMDGGSFGPSELTMRSTNVALEGLHDSVASTVRSRRNRVEVSIVEMVRSKNRCSDSLGRRTIGETTHAGRCARPADDRHVTMTCNGGLESAIGQWLLFRSSPLMSNVIRFNLHGAAGDPNLK